MQTEALTFHCSTADIKAYSVVIFHHLKGSFVIIFCIDFTIKNILFMAVIDLIFVHINYWQIVCIKKIRLKD